MLALRVGSRSGRTYPSHNAGSMLTLFNVLSGGGSSVGRSGLPAVETVDKKPKGSREVVAHSECDRCHHTEMLGTATAIKTKKVLLSMWEASESEAEGRPPGSCFVPLPPWTMG